MPRSNLIFVTDLHQALQSALLQLDATPERTPRETTYRQGFRDALLVIAVRYYIDAPEIRNAQARIVGQNRPLLEEDDRW